MLPLSQTLKKKKQLGFRDTWTESSSFINIMWGEEEMKELESQSLVLGSWRVAIWDYNCGTQRLSSKFVTMEHKGLSSKFVTVEYKGLGIIFFLLVFLNLGKQILNCRTYSGKRMVMT